MTRARSRNAFALLTLIGAFAAGMLVQAGEGGAEVAPTVVRNALAESGNVKGAPDRTMVLSRVKVAPGAMLAPHHHRGTQIARVEAGTLTYSVIKGSVTVRSGEADQSPKVVRTIKAGQTGKIQAGHWIVEQPGMFHRAANRGAKPVVIYLATLLEKGAPPSSPLPEH